MGGSVGGSAESEPDAGSMRAFVGLGGNLGDRWATLRGAVRRLAAGALPDTRVVAASSVYETRPLGPSKEPFFNAVIELRTRLAPRVLLDGLLRIEVEHGRQRRRRWDARTLDLDLLLMHRLGPSGWERVDGEDAGLRLPHPHITLRDFVLVPLRELAGDEAIVRGEPAAVWLERLPPGAETILRRLDGALLEPR